MQEHEIEAQQLLTGKPIIWKKYLNIHRWVDKMVVWYGMAILYLIKYGDPDFFWNFSPVFFAFSKKKLIFATN